VYREWEEQKQDEWEDERESFEDFCGREEIEVGDDEAEEEGEEEKEAEEVEE
jgi:hypothetical protein